MKKKDRHSVERGVQRENGSWGNAAEGGIKENLHSYGHTLRPVPKHWRGMERHRRKESSEIHVSQNRGEGKGKGLK